MNEDGNTPKKKRTKKAAGDEIPKGFQDLAKLTSSDVIRQVKAGMSRIAPLEEEGEPSFNEDPPASY